MGVRCGNEQCCENGEGRESRVVCLCSMLVVISSVYVYVHAYVYAYVYVYSM